MQAAVWVLAKGLRVGCMRAHVFGCLAHVLFSGACERPPAGRYTVMSTSDTSVFARSPAQKMKGQSPSCHSGSASCLSSMGPMNIGIDLNLVKEKKQGPVSWVTRSSGKPAYREMLGFTGRDGIALRGALEAGGP